MNKDFKRLDFSVVYTEKTLRLFKKIFRLEKNEEKIYAVDFDENEVTLLEPYNSQNEEIDDLLYSSVSHYANIVNISKKNRVITIEITVVSEVKQIEKFPIKINSDILNQEKIIFNAGNSDSRAIIVGIYFNESKDGHFALFDNALSFVGNLTRNKVYNEKEQETSEYFFELVLDKRNHRVKEKIKYVLLVGNIFFTKTRENLSFLDINLIDTIRNDIKYYLNLWDKYNEKEKVLEFKKAKEFGFVNFDSFEGSTKGFIKLYFRDYEFDKLLNCSDIIFIVGNENIKKLHKCANLKEYIDMEKKIEQSTTLNFKKQDVNIYEKSITFSSKDWRILNDSKNRYMAISLIGTGVMFKRREVAKNNIVEGKSGIPVMHTWFTDVPKAQRLIEKINLNHSLFKNKNLTINQIEAIDIICNTPDIAIIQGPPGTGKTTVINEAIIQINAYQQQSSGSKANNLVTGFRHETVMNISEKVRLFGLPAIKIGSKSQDESDNSDNYTKIEQQVKLYIEELIDKLNMKYENIIIQDKDYKSFLKIKDNYILFKNSLEEELMILEDLKKIPQLAYNNELNKKIESYKRKVKKEDKQERFINSLFLDSLYRVPITESAYLDQIDFILDEFDSFTGSDELEEDKEKIIKMVKSKSFSFSELRDLRRNLILKYTPKTILFSTSKEKSEIIDFLEKLEQDFKVNRIRSINGESIALLDYIDSISENPVLVRETLLNYAKVLGATDQQAVSKDMFDIAGTNKKIIFDNVFVDEAATSPPLDLFIPMSIAKRRLVLVGDHKQLPNITNEVLIAEIESEVSNSDEIKSRIREELKDSLFEHLYYRVKKLEEADGIKRIITLNTQFRMHPKLGELISNQFYKEEGGLKSPIKADFFEHQYGNLYNKYAHWIDVPYEGNNSQYRDGNSRKNLSEARIIAEHIKKSMYPNPLQKLSVGIIALYRPQVGCIKDELFKQGIIEKDNSVSSYYKGLELEFGTVDAFQGKEFDIVYLSIVYTFEPENYLRESYSRLVNSNLLNVALSRQKKLLIVVGNKAIFKNDKARILTPSLVELLSISERLI